MTSSKVENALLYAALIAFIVCQSSCAGLLLWMYPTAKRVDAASSALLVCRYQDAQGKWHGNPNCAQSLVQAIGGSVRSVSGDIAKATKEDMPIVSKAVKEWSAASVSASNQINALSVEGTGAVKDLRKLLNEDVHNSLTALHDAINSLNTEIKHEGGAVHVLLDDSDLTIKAATKAIDQLTVLEAALTAQISKLDPEVTKVLEAMLALVQSEDITGTLKNINAGTKSGKEILDTIDIATRGLRQKAALVKAILLKLVGLVHLQFSPF